MNPRVKKQITVAIKITIAVAALFYVFTKIEFSKIITIYKDANILMLVAGLLFFVGSKWIASLRLNLFFKSIGIKISHIYNLKLYLLGMFYNLFLPGGIGGDGYKIYLLNKAHKNIKTKHIFWSVLIDRVSGLLALFCLAVGFSYSVGYFIDYRLYIWLLIPVALVAAYFIIRFFFGHLMPVFTYTVLLSFGVQLGQTVTAFFLLQALGVQERFVEYIFVFLISSIVAALPVSIGGIGAREITFLFASGLLQLNSEVSVALSLMFYIITAFTSFFGIYYHVHSRKITAGLSISADAQQTE